MYEHCHKHTHPTPPLTHQSLSDDEPLTIVLPLASLAASTGDTAEVPLSDLDIPIAHRKGNSPCTSHPLSNFVSFSYLSPSV